MAEPSPPRPETAASNRDAADSRNSGRPRWVSVSAIIAAIVLVALVVGHLTTGGFRGHLPAGDVPPAIVDTTSTLSPS
jgi:hypothetical protein